MSVNTEPPPDEDPILSLLERIAKSLERIERGQRAMMPKEIAREIGRAARTGIRRVGEQR